jgi:predicted dehydrogenase
MTQPNIDVTYWGIIGCGHIAETFAESFTATEGGKLYACAATDVARAKKFAAQFGVENVHPSYLALVSDSAIDAVYIATTHNFHFEHIMLCLNHNKHVLCEKPITINAKQARQVQQTAQKRNLLVVEAMWTRFLPAIAALKDVLQQGVIGDIKSMYANFSINRDLPDQHRLLNPALAGGALLDLGIYPITMADIVFDEPPVSAAASAIMTHTGVDQVSNYFLRYTGGKTALLSAGFKQSAPIEAVIHGEKGHIRIPHFLGARSFEVCLDGQSSQQHHYDYVEEHKFMFEINHVNQCLQQGKTDSPLLPLSKSIAIVELMDELRAQFGLVYADD